VCESLFSQYQLHHHYRQEKLSPPNVSLTYTHATAKVQPTINQRQTGRATSAALAFWDSAALSSGDAAEALEESVLAVLLVC
jgi:hypothetical protein